MKILHTVAPAEFGGLEEVVIRLAGGLRDRGHRVSVASVLTGGPRTHPFIEALEGRGVEVHPCFFPPRSYRLEVARIGELVRDLQPDVVHTHGYRPDVLHPRVARRLGAATVSTLHGFVGGGLKNRFYEWMQIRSIRSLDAVVAVSRPMADRLRRRGVSEGALHTLPNAWEPRGGLEPAPVARGVLGVPDGAFHLGWIGRLGREKGPDVLLEALSLLPDLDAHVSFVGDGRLRRDLERRAGDVSGPRISFHGAVPDAGRLFSAFDLVVLSSRTEGTPIVLFEAMAASVPVVGTAVGGVPDVIDDDTALLVPPEDPPALARAIRWVVQSPDAARARAERASRTLRERFSVGPWLRGYEAVYSTLVEGRPTSARSSA